MVIDFLSRVRWWKYNSRSSHYIENSAPGTAFLGGPCALAFCLEGGRLYLGPWEPLLQPGAHLASLCSHPLVITHSTSVPSKPGRIWTWSWCCFLEGSKGFGDWNHQKGTSMPCVIGRVYVSYVFPTPKLATFPENHLEEARFLNINWFSHLKMNCFRGCAGYARRFSVPPK